MRFLLSAAPGLVAVVMVVMAVVEWLFTLSFGLPLIPNQQTPRRQCEMARTFNVVQENFVLTPSQIVSGLGFEPGLISDIEMSFDGQLGQSVGVVMEKVIDIQPAQPQKYRYVTSRVTSN